MAWWQPGGNVFCGIDVGASAIKVVRLCRERRGIKLLGVGLKELSIEPELPREEVLSAIRALVPPKGSGKAVLNFSGLVPFIRTLSMPLMPQEELSSALFWEAKKLVTLPQEEILLDYILLKNHEEQEGKQQKVVLVIAQKSRVKFYCSVVQEAGVKIAAIDIGPLCALNAIRFRGQEPLVGTVLYVDMGAVKTDMTIIKGGVFQLTRRLEMGGEGLTLKMAKELSLSYAEAEKLKREQGLLGEKKTKTILVGEIDRFVSEIQRSIDYYISQIEEEHLSAIILMGGGSLLPGLAESMQPYFRSPVKIDQPFSGVHLNQAYEDFYAMAPRFSVGMGLALRARI